MTTYRDIGPYIPEPDFPSWIAKKRLPQAYEELFSWPKEQLQDEYDNLHSSWKELKQRLEERTQAYEEIHNARISYMEHHSIEQWSDLDENVDQQHILEKDKFMKTVADINNERLGLKEQISSIYPALPLIYGIIHHIYTNYEKICDDERSTHGLTSSNSWDPRWRNIGPLQNPFWKLGPGSSDFVLELGS
jgi:hypothetical protein